MLNVVKRLQFLKKEVVTWERNNEANRLELVQIERDFERVSSRVDEFIFTLEFKESLINLETKKAKILSKRRKHGCPKEKSCLVVSRRQ